MLAGLIRGAPIISKNIIFGLQSDSMLSTIRTSIIIIYVDTVSVLDYILLLAARVVIT